MRQKPLADSETDTWWSKGLVSGRISDPASQSTRNWHCFCNTTTWKIVGLGVGWVVMKFPQLLLTSPVPRESLISFCPYLGFQFHHQTQGEQLVCLSMQSLHLSQRSPWGNPETKLSSQPNTNTPSLQATWDQGKALWRLTQPLAAPWLVSALQQATAGATALLEPEAGCYQATQEQDVVKWLHTYHNFKTRSGSPPCFSLTCPASGTRMTRAACQCIFWAEMN